MSLIEFGDSRCVILIYCSCFLKGCTAKQTLRSARWHKRSCSDLQDFASWRKQQIEEQLPDPEEEGVGLSMYLASWPLLSPLHFFLLTLGGLDQSSKVGRQPGGIQWNDLWLNMVGQALQSGH